MARQRFGVPWNDEKFGMLYGSHIRPLIRRGIALRSAKGIIICISCKEVLYGHSERSGVLYGNHVYTVISDRSMK